MDRFNELGRGAQLMLVGSVLLLIDSFLNWQQIDTAIGSFGQSAWHGFWGVVMGLLTIVLIAWLVARLAAVDVPLPPSITGAVLSFLILVFAVIKNLTDDYSSFWSYVGIVLAAIIAVGGWMQVQEQGGMDKLRTEAGSVGGSLGSSSRSSDTTAASATAPEAAGAAASASTTTVPDSPPPPVTSEAAAVAGEPPAPAEPLGDDAGAVSEEPPREEGTTPA
jgi:hypothetical protein